MAKKKCARCEGMKDVEDFPFTNTKKNKRSYWCKGCHSDYRKEWRKTKPNYNKEHYAKYPEIRKSHIVKLVISPKVSQLVTESLLEHILDKGYKLNSDIKSMVQDALDLSVFNLVDNITKRAKFILDNIQLQKRIKTKPPKPFPTVITPTDKSKNNIKLLLEAARRGDPKPPPKLIKRFYYFKKHEICCQEYSEFMKEIKQTTNWLNPPPTKKPNLLTRKQKIIYTTHEFFRESKKIGRFPKKGEKNYDWLRYYKKKAREGKLNPEQNEIAKYYGFANVFNIDNRKVRSHADTNFPTSS